MSQPIVISEILIAAAILMQNIEYFMIRESWIETGVWRWSLIRQEFSSLQWVLDLTLNDKSFHLLLVLRTLAAIILLFQSHWSLLLLLWISSLLISLRWRGIFNGGSDYMTFIVLSGLLFASLLESFMWASKAAAWYICIHACSSYFISGWSKFKNPEWRKGVALAEFIHAPGYCAPSRLGKISMHSPIFLIAAWSVILFELCFPVALFYSETTYFFIFAALFFHLGNTLIFGLNRFLFAWLPTYPLIWYCANL